MEFKYLEHLTRNSNSRRRYLVIGIAGVIVLAALGAALWYALGREPSPPPGTVLNEQGEYVPYAPGEASGHTVDVTYTCPNGEQFSTSYDFGSNELTLTLADGSTHALPQAGTDGSARYAKQDGSVVFVEERGRAKVEMNGETTLSDCAPKLSVEATPTPVVQ